MNIRINRAYFPVTVLGLGRRIGIWLQGCSIGCPGCTSRDTWSTDSGYELPIDSLLNWCLSISPRDFDGVTITGGEPFEQPAALRALLDGLRSWRSETQRCFDVLCYSGMPFRRLESEYSDLLTKLDAVIPEPYVRTAQEGKIWRGSLNQSLVPLSELGRQRYRSYIDKDAPVEGGLEVRVTDGEFWCVGIPRRGDLDKLVQVADRAGVTLRNLSWRA